MQNVPKLYIYIYNIHIVLEVWSSGGSTNCTCQLTAVSYVTSLSVVSYDGYSAHASDKLHMHFLQGDDVVSLLRQCWGIHVMYSAWNPKDNNA